MLATFYLNTFKDFKTKIIVTIGYKKRPKMVYFVGGNSETLSSNFNDFKRTYAEKHNLLIKPLGSFLATIRSKLSSNHFRKDIKFQHTFDISIHAK